MHLSVSELCLLKAHKAQGITLPALPVYCLSLVCLPSKDVSYTARTCLAKVALEGENKKRGMLVVQRVQVSSGCPIPFNFLALPVFLFVVSSPALPFSLDFPIVPAASQLPPSCLSAASQLPPSLSPASPSKTQPPPLSQISTIGSRSSLWVNPVLRHFVMKACLMTSVLSLLCRFHASFWLFSGFPSFVSGSTRLPAQPQCNTCCWCCL